MELAVAKKHYIYNTTHTELKPLDNKQQAIS
jgi:hypothetical protein